MTQITGTCRSSTWCSVHSISTCSGLAAVEPCVLDFTAQRGPGRLLETCCEIAGRRRASAARRSRQPANLLVSGRASCPTSRSVAARTPANGEPAARRARFVVQAAAAGERDDYRRRSRPERGGRRHGQRRACVDPDRADPRNLPDPAPRARAARPRPARAAHPAEPGRARHHRSQGPQTDRKPVVRLPGCSIVALRCRPNQLNRRVPSGSRATNEREGPRAAPPFRSARLERYEEGVTISLASVWEMDRKSSKGSNGVPRSARYVARPRVAKTRSEARAAQRSE